MTYIAGANEITRVTYIGSGSQFFAKRASEPYRISPTLYLKSNVKITNGDGSLENPYELSL